VGQVESYQAVRVRSCAGLSDAGAVMRACGHRRWEASEKRQGTKSRGCGRRDDGAGLWGFEVGGEGGGGAWARPEWSPGPARMGLRLDRRAAEVVAWWPGRRRRLPIGRLGARGGGPAVVGAGAAVGQLHGWHYEMTLAPVGGARCGRYLGAPPRAKTSMTSMRPPQQGHGSARGWLASAVSTVCDGVAGGGT
jgi:hypothetical protein